MSEDFLKRTIGVDVGLDWTNYALVDIRGTILARDRFKTFECPEMELFVSTLCEHLITFMENNGGYELVRSVGISAPNANFKTGAIEYAPNLPWKGEVPLAAMVRDRLGLACAIGNDAHTMALCEKVYGSARGLKDFIVVSIGKKGIGSCFYSQGVPHIGAEGFAGEFGHTCVVENGRECGCGKKGCLETYGSEYGCLMTAKELLEQSDEPSALRGSTLTLDVLKTCAEQGDPIAKEAFCKTAEVLGIALANYATVVDPEAIILTESMSHVGDVLMEPLKEAFERYVFHNIKNKVRIEVSVLSDEERDVLGASALAWDVKEYSLFT